jgi:hypothetical protein
MLAEVVRSSRVLSHRLLMNRSTAGLRPVRSHAARHADSAASNSSSVSRASARIRAAVRFLNPASASVGRVLAWAPSLRGRHLGFGPSLRGTPPQCRGQKPGSVRSRLWMCPCHPSPHHVRSAHTATSFRVPTFTKLAPSTILFCCAISHFPRTLASSMPPLPPTANKALRSSG